MFLFSPLNPLPFISGEIWKPEDALASYGRVLGLIDPTENSVMLFKMYLKQKHHPDWGNRRLSEAGL